MSKSYKKKQHTRREGIESVAKHKDNHPDLRKVGKIWVDQSDEEDQEEELDEIEYDYDDDYIEVHDAGDSIIIGRAGLPRL